MQLTVLCGLHSVRFAADLHSFIVLSALGPRTFKHYNFPSVKFGRTPDVVESEMRVDHFSSAPGLLASLDDFYIVTSPTAQLAVIETTHDNYNPKLFDFVKPQTVLCWMRVIVANTLAIDGKSWATLFSTAASGTYTNQVSLLPRYEYSHWSVKSSELLLNFDSATRICKITSTLYHPINCIYSSQLPSSPSFHSMKVPPPSRSALKQTTLLSCRALSLSVSSSPRGDGHACTLHD